MADSQNIDLNEVIAELSPEGRLHFDNAQLRVLVKKLQAELTAVRDRPSSDG